MRWVGLSNVQRLLAGWLVTPQLMGRSVIRRAVYKDRVSFLQEA
jgi:hypothetical protein